MKQLKMRQFEKSKEVKVLNANRQEILLKIVKKGNCFAWEGAALIPKWNITLIALTVPWITRISQLFCIIVGTRNFKIQLLSVQFFAQRLT